jgi:protein-L-isoaspartate(D-aspartate) O-methyltransferase
VRHDIDEPELESARSPLVSASVERLVLDLASCGSLQSEAVRRAFRRVERHRFVTRWYRLQADSHRVSWSAASFDPQAPDADSLRSIYSEVPLVTHVDGVLPTSSSTSPRLMAVMLEGLDLRPGMRVLEIGTGTGYNAALLAEILGDPGQVFTVDLRPDIAKEARTALNDTGYGDVHVLCRDGFWGVSEAAPFDRVIATVGFSDVSAHWLEQLAPDGFVLVPLQHGLLHPLVRVTRGDGPKGTARARVIGSSSFMPSSGVLRWINPWQSYLLGGIPSRARWTRRAFAGLPDKSLGDMFRDPVHQSFHFYLALSSRELWYSGVGYGLADPGAGAVVVVTPTAVEGYCQAGGDVALNALYRRLAGLAAAWRDLGCPAMGEYDISFLPKNGPAALHLRGGTEWVIERIASWEVVRLPEASKG